MDGPRLGALFCCVTSTEEDALWMHSEGEGKFVNLNRGMMTSIVFNFFFPPSVSMCVCKVIELQLLSPLAVLCEW